MVRLLSWPEDARGTGGVVQGLGQRWAGCPRLRRGGVARWLWLCACCLPAISKGEVEKPKVWGEPGYWVKLLQIVPTGGVLSPPFVPDSESLVLFVADPHAMSVTLRLVLDLTKYNAEYCPKITVDGTDVQYTPTAPIMTTIVLNTLPEDQVFVLKVADPQSEGGGFLSMFPQSSSHEYRIKVEQAPDAKAVVFATSLVVRSTSGRILISDPPFDPLLGSQTLRYDVDEHEFRVQAVLKCPDGGGNTQRFDDGLPTAVDKDNLVDLGQEYSQSVQLQCVYRPSDWPSEQPSLTASYTLVFERNLRDGNDLRATLMIPAERGYCEMVDREDPQVNRWRGNWDARNAFVCRVDSDGAPLFVSVASPTVGTSLEASDGKVTDLSTTELRALPPVPSAEMFTLRTFDKQSEIRYPLLVIRVANCSTLPLIPGHARLELKPGDLTGRLCLGGVCSKQDADRCFWKLPDCSSFPAGCGDYGHLRPDLSEGFCAGKLCDEVRDADACCIFPPLEVGEETMYGGNRSVVFKVEDGRQAIADAGTCQTFKNVSSKLFSRPPSPPTFRVGEEVVIAGEAARVNSVDGDDKYTVQILRLSSTPRQIGAADILKSPSFVCPSLGQPWLRAGQLVSVHGRTGTLIRTCIGHVVCSVQFDDVVEPLAVAVGDIDVPPATSVDVGGKLGVVFRRFDVAGVDSTYSVVLEQSGEMLHGLHSHDMTRVDLPTFAKDEEVKVGGMTATVVSKDDGGVYTVKTVHGDTLNRVPWQAVSKVPDFFFKGPTTTWTTTATSSTSTATTTKPRKTTTTVTERATTTATTMTRAPTTTTTMPVTTTTSGEHATRSSMTQAATTTTTLPLTTTTTSRMRVTTTTIAQSPTTTTVTDAPTTSLATAPTTTTEIFMEGTTTTTTTTTTDPCPLDELGLSIGDRIWVSGQSAIVEELTNGALTVVYQGTSRPGWNVPRCNVEKSGLHEDDYVVVDGREGRVVGVELVGEEKFTVQFEGDKAPSGTPFVAKDMKPLKRTLHAHDRVSWQGHAGEVVEYREHLDAYDVKFDDGQMFGPFKGYELTVFAAQPAAAEDLGIGAEVKVFTDLGVVRACFESDTACKVSFFKRGPLTYTVPKKNIQVLDQAAVKPVPSSGGLTVGDHALVGGKEVVVARVPPETAGYEVLYPSGTIALHSLSEITPKVGPAGVQPLQIGDRVHVLPQRGGRAIIVLGPDNLDGWLVRFDDEGTFGGPYRTPELAKFPGETQRLYAERPLGRLTRALDLSRRALPLGVAGLGALALGSCLAMCAVVRAVWGRSMVQDPGYRMVDGGHVLATPLAPETTIALH